MAIIDYELKLKDLAKARQTLETAKLEKQKLLSALEDSPDYQKALQDESKARSMIDICETTLHNMALADYQVTHEKQITDFIGIREMTTLEYNPQEALEWTMVYLKNAVKLDKALFEKHAKAVAETSPLGFVVISKKPIATIATDLSVFLDK